MSMCRVIPVQGEVGLRLGHKEVHSRSHRQESNCCKRGEAPPEDQLARGQMAALQPDHLITLCVRVPIMALCAHGRVVFH